MALFDLNREAAHLSEAWKSHILGHVGPVNLKVLKMDGRAIAAEVHDYDEGLLVIDGKLALSLSGDVITVGAGELYIVKAGIPHTVAPGSTGVLVIIDLS